MTSSNGDISALLALFAGNPSVTGEFPTEIPVTRSFDVFFDLRPYKPLSKQSKCWWFETQSRSLWRHCNGASGKIHLLWQHSVLSDSVLFQHIMHAVRYHYSDVIMSAMASQITGVSIVCLLNRLFRRRSKKAPNFRVTSLFRGIHRSPVDSPHKGPVTRKKFPCHDVIMKLHFFACLSHCESVTWIRIVTHSAGKIKNLNLNRIALGPFSICDCAMSQPMKEDVTNVMSLFITWGLAHPEKN